MSLQGPVVIVTEKPAGGLVQAFAAAGAFPVLEACWADAAQAVASINPSAVVLAEPDFPDLEAALALAQEIAAAETYVPVIARAREDESPVFPHALPISDDAPVERVIARVSAAQRLRVLHATVIGRARALEAERNILAELPDGDALDDATVLVIGRGRQHPALSVAIGERMAMIGALSIDFAMRCLEARDIDGVVIGDGLPLRSVETLLATLAGDARFRDLPVAMLGASAGTDILPNVIRASDPLVLAERLVPLVRLRAFEAQLTRLLRSIESKGMLDVRTGLLRPEAFGGDLDRAIEDAAARGVALSVARFSFDGAVDARANMDAARLMSRLMRSVDFACRQPDGSLVAVFTDTDLRAAHVVARRLASVLKQVMLRAGRIATAVETPVPETQVTLATLKPADTPLTLMARVDPQPVAAA